MALVGALLAAGTTTAQATTIAVTTEAEYRQALADLSADPAGPHTVTVTMIDVFGSVDVETAEIVITR